MSSDGNRRQQMTNGRVVILRFIRYVNASETVWFCQRTAQLVDILGLVHFLLESFPIRLMQKLKMRRTSRSLKYTPCSEKSETFVCHIHVFLTVFGQIL